MFHYNVIVVPCYDIMCVLDLKFGEEGTGTQARYSELPAALENLQLVNYGSIQMQHISKTS